MAELTSRYQLGQLGPLMVDMAGMALTDQERDRLQHPMVGGLMLAARNYQSIEQLTALCDEIHHLRQPKLLIGVEQEGGRIQHFQSGFTHLPAMRDLGLVHDRHGRHPARRLAEQTGWVLAAELRACGVDFSLAPVLDVDHGSCGVIGNRAFHRQPAVVAELAHALQMGMRRGGMHAVGKHFPGHGHVSDDVCHALPVDPRTLPEIEAEELRVFRHMIDEGLAAIMPAHVIYPRVDSQAACFSAIWLQEILRDRLGFAGLIISDDLGVIGAASAGDMLRRVHAALDAGCDMVLICNQPAWVDHVLAHLNRPAQAVSLARFARMHGRPCPSRVALREDAEFALAIHEVGAVGLASAVLPFSPPDEASC
ncbi:beta-N-acetylhexosaminidase [Chitinivorax tropicus]|uniref:Beta-hexosaminidase n=1 Tax=Chitinivorax tropicus TaxID=714531 RepID=A0A840MRV6_9PROT|nr:beta-N-acetylhexosaminidase [Chitinivorax tropicus]MBB5020155.1 beta-N-acetylhexosaminidase [Chitinivorax tropicus]